MRTTFTSLSARRVGTVSQGSTVEETLANLKEATELYLEERDESVRVTLA